jgi:hypothetical protein
VLQAVILDGTHTDLMKEELEAERKCERIAFADKKGGLGEANCNLQTRMDLLHKEDREILHKCTDTRIDVLQQLSVQDEEALDELRVLTNQRNIVVPSLHSQLLPRLREESIDEENIATVINFEEKSLSTQDKGTALDEM